MSQSFVSWTLYHLGFETNVSHVSMWPHVNCFCGCCEQLPDVMSKTCPICAHIRISSNTSLEWEIKFSKVFFSLNVHFIFLLEGKVHDLTVNLSRVGPTLKGGDKGVSPSRGISYSYIFISYKIFISGRIQPETDRTLLTSSPAQLVGVPDSKHHMAKRSVPMKEGGAGITFRSLCYIPVTCPVEGILGASTLLCGEQSLGTTVGCLPFSAGLLQGCL